MAPVVSADGAIAKAISARLSAMGGTFIAESYLLWTREVAVAECYRAILAADPLVE